MYPVMLNLTGRRCLVVGGGGVALRKTQGLVAEGARVTLVSPECVEAIEALAADGTITLERRCYREGEAADYALILAATNDRAVNRQVFEDGERVGKWVNVADDPELCAFHLSGRVRRGLLEMTIASGGEAPFVVRRLRQLLERRFGAEWGEWARAAARFRELVRQAELEPEQQEAAYDAFFAGSVDQNLLRARVPSDEELERWLGEEAPAAAQKPEVSPEPVDASLGLVSLVGAGPGHPGLLTVRARQRLLGADVVVYDRLAEAALPPDLPESVTLHTVGKTAGNHPVPQEEINAMLVRLGREGRRVVRLKGGDPYVFGRGGEEAEALCEAGVPFEVVPGITSGIAAPSFAGIPVTHRREAVRLTLVTAHETAKVDGPQVRWDLMAQDPHATIVGYMGVTALPRVVHLLLGGGMRPDMPAALVERGTTAGQRQVISTLENLVDDVRAAGLKPPALFVIGPTVAHAPHLDWLSMRPIAGQRLVVPASPAERVEALELAGAEVIAVPLPVTAAARVAIGACPLTGCVLRSATDVDAFEDERGVAGWDEDVVAWCLTHEAAARARECGWRHVEELSGEDTHADLVERIRQRWAREL